MENHFASPNGALVENHFASPNGTLVENHFASSKRMHVPKMLFFSTKLKWNMRTSSNGTAWKTILPAQMEHLWKTIFPGMNRNGTCMNQLEHACPPIGTCM